MPSAANTSSAVRKTSSRLRAASARRRPPCLLTTGACVPYSLSGAIVPILCQEEANGKGHRGLEDGMEASMRGKRVVFTGASRGMGHFAAVELARRGAEIVVVGHNEARGAAAVKAIRSVGASADFLRADMGDASDVRKLAEAVLARQGSIDVLIHSAGGLAPAGARTREGVNRGFAQNFLGAYLLTRLLEERLLASAPARVIAVGSSTHRMVKTFDVNALLRPVNSPRSRYQMGSSQMRSYQTAKLA